MFTLRFDMRAPANGASTVDLYRAAIEMAEYGEKHGCLSALISEHHSSSDGYVPSPLVFASAIAARTTTLPIVVGALLLNFYDPIKAAEFNRMEKLRDPSHVRAMPVTGLKGLFDTAGLPEPRVVTYVLRDELENLLQRSFPNPGDDAKIREIFAASAIDDRLGIPVRRDGNRFHYAYPVAVLAADRA